MFQTISSFSFLTALTAVFVPEEVANYINIIIK